MVTSQYKASLHWSNADVNAVYIGPLVASAVVYWVMRIRKDDFRA